MAAKYLIEVRFGGEIKSRLRNIISDIADRFNERTLVRSHYVPHISLYGPFRTKQQKTVLARMRDTCSQYDIVPYRLQGFEHFDRETIYADVHSSQALRRLRSQLSRELQDVTYGEQSYDHDRWFKFHSTVARHVGRNFDDIWNYVTSAYELCHEGYVERVSLIRNGNIVKEYSVPQGRFLSSNAATSRPAWLRDEELIQRYSRPADHDKLIRSQPGRVRKWKTLFRDLRSGEIGQRRNVRFDDRAPKTFLSGDLHLNHANIIEYCDRPFDSVYEMNQQLVSNWNDTVGPQDKVVFLGDLAFYNGEITTHDWLHALNGDIVFLRGNHDGAESIDYKQSHILESDSREYYCTHRPNDIPEDWDGWAIHGHVHNNDTEEHPFINHQERRINIAPELTGYTPIEMIDVESTIESYG